MDDIQDIYIDRTSRDEEFGKLLALFSLFRLDYFQEDGGRRGAPRITFLAEHTEAASYHFDCRIDS